MSFSKFIKSIFGTDNNRPQSIVCCYCLKKILVETNSNTCSHCHSELPVQYRENYADAPPFFIQVAGWSRVGKTVFLQALTMIIQRLGYIWPQFTYQPISEVSLKFVQEIECSLREGRMPESTRQIDHDIYVMLLKHMERWGGHSLVIRDCSGEIFDRLQIPVEQAPFLTHTPTTFLMISLSDLDNKELNPKGRVMGQLFFSYIDTLKKQNISFKGDKRRVVIVFSKADSIVDLPDNLYQYLSEDPIWTAIHTRNRIEMNAEKMWDYVEAMRHTSDQIKEWIQVREVSADNLIKIADDEGIDLVFSLISSTGAQPENGRLPHLLEPRRVLDPFFWALEFQSSSH